MFGKGYQVFAADAALGTSGAPMAVYGLTIVSGGTPGVVIIRNGTSAAGAAVITLTGVADSTSVFDFGGVGVVLGDGGFVDINANVTSATVWFEKV